MGAPSGGATHWRVKVPPLGSLEPFLEAVSHDCIMADFLFLGGRGGGGKS